MPGAGEAGPAFMEHGMPPPDSLGRRADEERLKDVRAEIDRFLFLFVQTLRHASLNPWSYTGGPLDPMRPEQVRAFVNEHFAELYPHVPARLTEEYARLEAKLAVKDDAADVAQWDDFRGVRWYGTEYIFTATQARCVEVLWAAWQGGVPAVGQAQVLEDADSACKRLLDVFDGGHHPAWGTLITSPRKGAYCLTKPAR
jgi:hypothetical protein